ncbi:cold-shock protein [Bradyrhizobium yuanmingense]|uniref:Cold shock CspA family protein n=1 Tax=Bradyrhizobium yuanmingense TaxID=108015 RepID=A0ABV4G8L9_9BRAD|nr:cold shock domain-containing protein [Bradyrhizobium yuanmingense]
MQTGTVVSYSVEKGWGFIRPDDRNGKDLFVHMSELRDCAGADLVPGTRVTFDLRFNKQRSPSKARDPKLTGIDDLQRSARVRGCWIVSKHSHHLRQGKQSAKREARADRSTPSDRSQAYVGGPRRYGY